MQDSFVEFWYLLQPHYTSSPNERPYTFPYLLVCWHLHTNTCYPMIIFLTVYPFVLPNVERKSIYLQHDVILPFNMVAFYKTNVNRTNLSPVILKTVERLAMVLKKCCKLLLMTTCKLRSNCSVGRALA